MPGGVGDNWSVEETESSGTLELAGEGSSSLVGCRGAIDELARSNGIVSPSPMEVASDSEVINIKYGLSAIDSILESVIADPDPSNHQVILDKCFNLLKAFTKKGDNVLTKHLNQQLTTLLAKDIYPQFRGSLCGLLIIGEYEFSEEQRVELNKLVVTSNFTLLTELLVAKRALSVEGATHIIKTVTTSKIDHPSYSLYKEQLETIVQSFNSNSGLKEVLLGQMINFFQSCVNKELVSGIVKLIEDPSFFSPLLTEAEEGLCLLEKLLRVERLVADVKSQSGAPASEFIPSKFNYLIEEPDIIITDSSAKFILESGKIEIQNKHLSYKECIGKAVNVQKLVGRIIQNRLPINAEFIDCYEKYLMEFLPNLYFNSKTYPVFLKLNTENCAILLQEEYDISQGCLEALIKSWEKCPVKDPEINRNIAVILSGLAFSGKIPESCSSIALKILKSILDAQDVHTIDKTALSFECLARLGIHNDSFTGEICAKHLVEGSLKTKESILKGLDFIVMRSFSITANAAESLTRFILDIQQEEEFRIKAINILQKADGAITEKDLSSLAKLLTGEKRIVCAKLEVEKYTLPAGSIHVSANPTQLGLEYLKLEKYAAFEGFRLKGINIDDNSFFQAVSDQLTSLGQNKQVQEVISSTIEELQKNQRIYEALLLEGTTVEEHVNSLIAGMARLIPVSGLVVQAVANALKVNINFYRSNGTSYTAVGGQDNLQINIGEVGFHYLPLINYVDEASSVAPQEDAREASSLTREVIDYKIAQAVTKLLVKYAATHGALPPSSIHQLEQALYNDYLVVSSLEALSIIAIRTPSLLKAELLEYVKEQNLRLGQQISFDTALEALDRLLVGDPENGYSQIKEDLDKLIVLLGGSQVQKLDRFYELVGKILTSKPALFEECLLLVKYASSSQKNISIVSQLLDFDRATYQDLCCFIDKGYKLEKLYKALEKYFNDNLKTLEENSRVLGEILSSFKSVASVGGLLQGATINNLTVLAITNPPQVDNIIKILHIAVSNLEDNHFIRLEKLFEGGSPRRISSLANLFSKGDKQLTMPQSIAALFAELDQGTPLNILPTDDLKLEAKLLLQLKSSTSTASRLEVLQSLENGELHEGTIKTIFELVKHKDLSEACIKVLAGLIQPPNLDQETSEIICKLKGKIPNEYQRLKPFLSVDLDIFLQSENQGKLRIIIEKRFSNLELTGCALEKIERNLELISNGLEFTQEVVLGEVLDKANSIDEWSRFLEFIIKNQIPEIEVTCYLAQSTLTKIMDIIESKILAKSLEALGFLKLDDLIEKITYFCYQIKSCGWSARGLADILQKVTSDNASHVLASLRTIYEYQIIEEHRNTKGESVFDIFDKYSSADLEPSIYSLVSNQFEHKIENQGAELLRKVIELNPALSSKAGDYLSTLSMIREMYSNSPDAEPIKNWNKDQIKEWALNFKASHTKNPIRAKAEESAYPKDELAKVIAILQRANNLHTDGHLLRDTQIVSLLLMLDTETAKAGKLLQVATGEGKSTISATLAAVLALYGYKIDLITSSRVLASTGQAGAKGFFELIGLKCGLNTEEGPRSGAKPCYGYDIVYGDSLTFQSDFLSNTSNQGPKRGDRDFSVSIVDEVDSMLLDSSNNFAKQASPTPLMEYLLPIMVLAWHNFQSSILPLNLQKQAAIESAKEMIESLIDSMPIPKHLQGYAKFQAKNWAISLVGATTQWQLDRDYVINVDAEGRKVINPVDNSTGVTQESMVWQNGLHQFLQIKHNCRVSPEGLTSFFITNISYFLKYDRILGMTGTLGSLGSQDFLKTVYGIDINFVPTYKDKQVIELPGRLENTKEQLMQAVVTSSYQEAVLHGRAVLIVCQTIKDVESLSLELKKYCGAKARIINYSRSEERLYNTEIDQATRSNTIIVATNLAGRGTDIRTSPEVEANGGLHVISTFIARNARDEAQVKGRTARQGNCGSYQIIALDRGYYDHESFGANSEEIINTKRQERDKRELAHIKHSIEHSIPTFLAQDELYNKFSKLYLDLIEVPNQPTIKNCKIKQLIEDFGLWLKTRSEDEDIETFLTSAKEKYQSGSFTNPSYLVTQHYGVGDGRLVLKALQKAIETEGIYNFAALYYVAKARINMGSGQDENYKGQAVDSLMEAHSKLLELLSYLMAMNIAVSESGVSADNELLKQITTKITFFKSFAKHIESVIDVISSSGDKEVRVKVVVTKEELAPELTKSDIAEIEFLGIDVIYEVETYKPPQEWGDTIFVACCAIVQMAVGALITIGTLGGGAAFGVSMFVEGLMDAYKIGMALSKDVAINLEDYLTAKAISYAVIGAQAGFSKLASVGSASKVAEAGARQSAAAEAAKSVSAEMASSQLTTKAVTQLAKVAGIQLAKTVAIEKIAEWASDEIRDNLLDGLEEKIGRAIFKATKTALEKNAILLMPNCDVERGKIIREIQAAISRATKVNKNAQAINELASGVFRAASSHSSLGTVLYSIHKCGSMIDAAAKIEPTIDDIKEEINAIINRAGMRALQRLRGASAASSEDEQAAIRDSLCNQVSSMVARSVLNLIQRKITAPIVGSSVGHIVERSLEEYQQNQREVLEVYSQAAREKNCQAKLYKELESLRTDEENEATGVAAGDDNSHGRAKQKALTKKEAEEGRTKIRKIEKPAKPPIRKIGVSTREESEASYIPTFEEMRASRYQSYLTSLEEFTIFLGLGDRSIAEWAIKEYRGMLKRQESRDFESAFHSVMHSSSGGGMEMSSGLRHFLERSQEAWQDSGLHSSIMFDKARAVPLAAQAEAGGGRGRSVVFIKDAEASSGAMPLGAAPLDLSLAADIGVLKGVQKGAQRNPQVAAVAGVAMAEAASVFSPVLSMSASEARGLMSVAGSVSAIGLPFGLAATTLPPALSVSPEVALSGASVASSVTLVPRLLPHPALQVGKSTPAEAPSMIDRTAGMASRVVSEVGAMVYEAQISSLKKLSVILLDLNEQYQELEQMHPKTAAMLRPALSVSIQTTAGAIAAGPGGAAGGAFFGLKGEATSIFVDHVAGEQIGAGIKVAIELGAKGIKVKYPELTEQEAVTLASGMVMAAGIGVEGSVAIKQVSKATKEMRHAKVKLPEAVATKPEALNLSSLKPAKLQEGKMEFLAGAHVSEVMPSQAPAKKGYIKEVNYDRLSAEHFDHDLRYIDAQKRAGAKLESIDPAVKARMADLIRTDKSGRITGVFNVQDHHVIPSSVKGAKALFEEVGLDIDKGANRKLLPADPRLPSEMSIHRGKHEGDVVDPIQRGIDEISKALKGNTINKEQARRELEKLIERERLPLDQGKRLNSVNRG